MPVSGSNPTIPAGDLEIDLVHRWDRMRGRDLHLTPEKFADIEAEIVRAVDSFKMPEREKQELVNVYVTAMPQVVRSEAYGTPVAGVSWELGTVTDHPVLRRFDAVGASPLARTREMSTSCLFVSGPVAQAMNWPSPRHNVLDKYVPD